MAKTTFDTNPVFLQSLLKTCEEGDEISTSMAHDSGLELIEAD